MTRGAGPTWKSAFHSLVLQRRSRNTAGQLNYYHHFHSTAPRITKWNWEVQCYPAIQITVLLQGLVFFAFSQRPTMTACHQTCSWDYLSRSGFNFSDDPGTLIFCPNGFKWSDRQTDTQTFSHHSIFHSRSEWKPTFQVGKIMDFLDIPKRLHASLYFM